MRLFPRFGYRPRRSASSQESAYCEKINAYQKSNRARYWLWLGRLGINPCAWSWGVSYWHYLIERTAHHRPGQSRERTRFTCWFHLSWLSGWNPTLWPYCFGWHVWACRQKTVSYLFSGDWPSAQKRWRRRHSYYRVFACLIRVWSFY